MKLKHLIFAPASCAALLSISALPAHAEGSLDAVQGYIAGGLATLPEYEGADAQQVIPFIAGKARSGGRYIALEGVSARANILDSATWELGPVASITFGRDEDVDSAAVARMAELDDAVELGGFIARNWSDLALAGDSLRLELRATSDASDVHGGWQSSLLAGYSAPTGNRLRLGYEASLTFVSDDYAQTYFSVNAADAAASGLGLFEADGGLKDAGISANATYALNETWSLTGFAGYRRLLGDAADSPVVDLEGSPDQLSAGIGLGFSF